MDFEGNRNCFLADLGKFYGKELLNGILFIPQKQEKTAEVALSTSVNDLVFLCSPAGIPAIGRIVSAPVLTPFPAWRCREGKIGERGYTIEVEPFLLRVPLPLEKLELPYLTPLTPVQAQSLIGRILTLNPALSGSEWIKRFLQG